MNKAALQTSRIRWIKRAVESDKRIACLEVKVERLTASRDRWKERADALDMEVARLKRKIREEEA